MDVEAILSEIGETPTEIARKLGVSDGHIHDLKSRRRGLTLKMAARIERAVGRTGIVEAVAAERAKSAKSEAA